MKQETKTKLKMFLYIFIPFIILGFVIPLVSQKEEIQINCKDSPLNYTIKIDIINNTFVFNYDNKSYSKVEIVNGTIKAIPYNLNCMLNDLYNK